MKNLRKLISLILCVSLVLGTFAAGGMTASADTVYTVTLDPGEGSGEPIVFRSSDQTEFPGWKDAQNLQFYLEDDGRMGFRLDSDYCPDTFIAPDDDFCFDTWSEGYTYHTLSSTNTVITALWNSNSFLIIGVNDVELDWDNYNAFCSFRPREAGTYGFYSNNADVNLIVIFDGKTYDIPYEDPFRFSKYLEANEVFTFEVKADFEYTDTISVTVASDVASYSLTPAEYTIENSGYSDITCSFDSLYLGPIVNDWGNIENANYIQFYLNGGTLTDGNGNSIPFLVDDKGHSGPSGRNFYSNDYSSSDETVIMSVWIDPEVYDAAAPGTYTGELVYDCLWAPVNFPGVSGSIPLTLVIPEPDTVYTVTLDPGEGSGEPLVFRSSDQTEFPGWHDAQDFQFYLDDNGEMGFMFDDSYVPDSFTAPAGYEFDGWQGATFFNTFPSGVTDIVFTAKWRTTTPASYSLSPSGYTIENSGYTDIPCSFDSLYLGFVTNEYGNEEKAECIGFIINGGTLTDGNGSSIPFLVDERFHFGAEDRVFTSNSFSSQEDTFIMSVWIDPEDYAAAAPGTYTGELVYDSEWFARRAIAGESGSIALTLVIPEPETEPSFSFAPSEAVLTNGGYNDIDCTVSSVTFGTVTDSHGEQFMPDSLKFRFESSYVKDGKGHYISVYAGAQTHNGTADLYTSPVMPDGTVDLALFINQDSYDAAPVGLYTGKVRYTCIWTDIAGHHSEGETGEIALTLVIPDTAVTATISANEVVRGDKLTWNITTQADVTWLKFNGTDENGNAYTSYYKYSNYNKGTTEASVTDTEDGRVWNIPMLFNYAGTQAVDNQTWTIEYRVSGSNEWKSAPGEPFNIKVGKNAAALAPAPAEGEFAPYSIIAAVSEDREENGAEYKYFYITTTDDVSKVKISFVNADTGKTKSATYQTTSTNVVDLDTENGYSVWTIRMKVTAQAQDNAYTVQVRGPAWGEGVVVMSNQ